MTSFSWTSGGSIREVREHQKEEPHRNVERAPPGQRTKERLIAPLTSFGSTPPGVDRRDHQYENGTREKEVRHDHDTSLEHMVRSHLGPKPSSISPLPVVDDDDLAARLCGALAEPHEPSLSSRIARVAQRLRGGDPPRSRTAIDDRVTLLQNGSLERLRRALKSNVILHAKTTTTGSTAH
ncbi:hypothetical protein [Salana multivorans]